MRFFGHKSKIQKHQNFGAKIQRHKATFDYFVKIELLDKNMTFNIVCARKKTRTVVQKRSPIHGNFPDDSYY